MRGIIHHPPPMLPQRSSEPVALVGQYLAQAPPIFPQNFDQGSIPQPVAYKHCPQSGASQLSQPTRGTLREIEEALNIALRTKVVPRNVQPPSQEESPPDLEIAPNAQGEYNILQHLSKIPAKITVYELIKRSPSHQDALVKFLQGMTVVENLPVVNLVQALMSLTKTPSLVFSDEEWAPEEHRSMPLCISVALNGLVVDSILIDTGASINVCPFSTLEELAVDPKDFQKVTTTVTAYDNSKRDARGGVKLQLKLGPA